MRAHRAGQITIEYFLLLAVIVVVTLGGLLNYHTAIATAFQNLLTKVAEEHLPLDDKGPAPESGPPSDPSPGPDPGPDPGLLFD